MIPRATWLLGFCALLLAGPRPAAGQEEGGRAGGPAVTLADRDEARRQIVRDMLGRPEVRDAARVAGVDLEAVAADVDHLEGEPLARAAHQAEELDRRLAIDGVISSTTLILLLIITILLIVILQN